MKSFSSHIARAGWGAGLLIRKMCCLVAPACVALCFSIPSLHAIALPPSNDTCEGAEVIPGDGPFPWTSSYLRDISGATVTNTDPVPGCFIGPVIESVWYVFTPSTSGVYAISASVDTRTTIRDTVMAVFTSVGGCGGVFVEYACNDDSGGDHNQSALAANFVAGTTYYIVVWESFLNQGSRHGLQLRVTKPEPPANDLCSGALVVPAFDGPVHLAETIDLFAATTTADPLPPPRCLDGQLVRSIWYEFTPTVGAFYTFSTCAGFTMTLVPDTFMALYRSDAGCVGPLDELGCVNDSCGTRAAVTAPLEAGATYYLIVWEYFETGEIDLSPIVGETEVQLRVEKRFPCRITWQEVRPQGFYLQFTNALGGTQIIHASSNLVDWAEIGVGQEIGPGLYEFTDFTPSPFGRFYRVLTE